MKMLFKVFSPLGILIDKSVSKIDFEAIDGFFTLLPKHIDFVSALKTGILTYTLEGGQKSYLACYQGILIKKGESVHLTTKLGILDDDLSHLTKRIEIDFKQMEESRKESNKTMAQLEISLTKGLLSMNKTGESHGDI